MAKLSIQSNFFSISGRDAGQKKAKALHSTEIPENYSHGCTFSFHPLPEAAVLKSITKRRAEFSSAAFCLSSADS
jgi:hypothetical protein